MSQMLAGRVVFDQHQDGQFAALDRAAPVQRLCVLGAVQGRDLQHLQRRHPGLQIRLQFAMHADAGPVVGAGPQRYACGESQHPGVRLS
jgi:hypothetical protein